MNGRLWLATLAMLAVLFAGCTAAPSPTRVADGSPPPTDLFRTSEGGGVTVVATWRGPDAGAVVELQLDTHSVDLDAIDLGDATLANDRGETLRAEPWSAPLGGHHRAGPLRFGGDAAAFLEGARSIRLVLRDIAGVAERTFEWTVEPTP